MKDLFETSSRGLHQDECLMGFNMEKNNLIIKYDKKSFMKCEGCMKFSNVSIYNHFYVCGSGRNFAGSFRQNIKNQEC